MNLGAHIDHTILKAEATRAQVDAIVVEAREYGFASVCVNGAYIAAVAEGLRGSSTAACATVGFPLGASGVAVMAFEALAAVQNGAKEIDFVAHLPHLLKGDYTAAGAEFETIVRMVRTAEPKIVVKVILETAVLMQGVSADQAEARIAAACRAAEDSGCDFAKTSTGFHPAGGATVAAVALLKKHCGGMKVKAAGSIRTYADALRMLEAGADRLGCSASVEIVKEARQTGQNR